jgi:type II secretory pathway pseudopilin PulG
MTWMRGLLEKVRARLHAEHGFSLLETVIAITVIFASLLALSYTATVGFGYESLARQRQSATALANGTMEQARGLAYAKIQTGMRTGDLAGDPNVVTGCAGDPAGTYRFLSCSPGTVPGSGEKIVHSPTATNAAPLVPHATTDTQNGITFTIRTYVTNDCTTVDGTVCTALDPYRVTVIVTWTGGRSYPTKLVRLQSLFYSPTGCRSMETHPFAAPCQPFFFGTASIPRGEIHIEGTVSNTSFKSGDLFTPALDSQVQHEQMTRAQAGYTPTGVQIVDGAGTRTAGGTTQVTAAADTDPGSPDPSPPPPYTGPPSFTLSTGGDDSVALTSSPGDTAHAAATTRAGVANVCPPAPDTNESDGRPCAGARLQQGGDLLATLTLGDGVGTATLARVAAASEPSKTFVDRVLYNESSTMLPSIAGCAPVSGADGCLEQSAVRRFGTINLGGLPSSVAGPASWSGPDAWNGYLVSIVGYADQVAAPVGRQVLGSSATGSAVPAPSASVTAGTVYYWNPATGSYAWLAATDGSLVDALQASTVTATATVNGKTVTVTISVKKGSVAEATAPPPPTTVGGKGGLSRTDSSAQATPPKLTLVYEVKVNGSLRANLTIAVNLKTMEARGVYAPAPLSGS